MHYIYSKNELTLTTFVNTRRRVTRPSSPQPNDPHAYRPARARGACVLGTGWASMKTRPARPAGRPGLAPSVPLRGPS